MRSIDKVGGGPGKYSSDGQLTRSLQAPALGTDMAIALQNEDLQNITYQESKTDIIFRSKQTTLSLVLNYVLEC